MKTEFTEDMETERINLARKIAHRTGEEDRLEFAENADRLAELTLLAVGYDHCEECNFFIPDEPMGELDNKHHAESCSLFNPLND